MNVTTNVLSSVGMCMLVGVRTMVCSVKVETNGQGRVKLCVRAVKLFSLFRPRCATHTPTSDWSKLSILVRFVTALNWYFLVAPLILLLLVCVYLYTCVWMHMPWHACGSKRTTLGSQLSPFTFTWVPQLHSGDETYPSTAWPDEPSHLPCDALVYEPQSKQLFDAV